jgi:hypothetical protein
MWRSPTTGYHFIIDGAHRISSLIAWVYDDYGDGAISRPFYSYVIPKEQKRFANQARQLIKQEVGTYADLQNVLKEPKGASQKEIIRARNLTRKIPLQWVLGNIDKAEESFFNINGNPAIIDQSELGILKARKKPNAIAMRAIVKGATGHKYWHNFPPEKRTEIEKLAEEIHNLLFEPQSDSQTVIRTLELPAAGSSYRPDTFKMVFDAVNTVNNITDAMWQVNPLKMKKKDELPDETDGSKTIEFLTNVKNIAALISGTDEVEKKSLGLHPMVYFYGSTGKLVPSAYVATLKFVRKLNSEDKFYEFTGIREKFESFLLMHKDFINQIGHSKGSRMRSVDSLLTMFVIVYDRLCAGIDDDAAIVSALRSTNQLSRLESRPTEVSDKSKSFSRNVKNAKFIEAAMEHAFRCPICRGYLSPDKMSGDHIIRKESGGTGATDNLQWTHPYCNHGYKEKLQSMHN